MKCIPFPIVAQWIKQVPITPTSYLGDVLVLCILLEIQLITMFLGGKLTLSDLLLLMGKTWMEFLTLSLAWPSPVCCGRLVLTYQMNDSFSPSPPLYVILHFKMSKFAADYISSYIFFILGAFKPPSAFLLIAYDLCGCRFQFVSCL